jgi:hypothetical protein
MKISTKSIVVAALLAAGVALAAPVLQRLAVIFASSVQIGSTGTAVTLWKAASTTYDFPSVGAGYCVQGPSITVAGATVGNMCQVSSNLGADGGSGPDDAVNLSCFVSAANTVIVKECVIAGDAGAINVADAGYTVRILK